MSLDGRLLVFSVVYGIVLSVVVDVAFGIVFATLFFVVGTAFARTPEPRRTAYRLGVMFATLLAAAALGLL